MATREQIDRVLRSEEPDWEIAGTLGSEELAYLRQLTRGNDPLLASRAVYLASRVRSKGSASILAGAAASGETSVRLAAASASKNLPEESRSGVLMRLLNDSDYGIRRVALSAVPKVVSRALRQKVDHVAHEDASPKLRQLAAQILGKISAAPQSAAR